MARQAGIFCWNKSTRLEAETQMTKTKCDLIHFEASYLCRSRREQSGYVGVGQAANDASNSSCLRAIVSRSRDFKDIWVPEDADVYFKNRLQPSICIFRHLITFKKLLYY